MIEKQLPTSSIGKASSDFIFKMFFDLLDVAMVNSHTVSQKLGQTDLRKSDFNAVIANSLMRNYINNQTAFP